MRAIPTPAISVIASLVVFATAATLQGDETSRPGQNPKYDAAFWKHWGDGHAELAGYRLRFPRYGEIRQGNAVTIFVTETFSNESRVKADPGQHSEDDTFGVMKLNLIHDFPTGVYDYNLMTSAFIALESVNSRPAGSPTKIAFSSQEWCGLLHSQYLFNNQGIDYTLHSYFDGEADQSRTLTTHDRGIAEDTLLLWARGFAGPVLHPGEATRVPILKGLQVARLQHQSPTWGMAHLSRSDEKQSIDVPAGTFIVDRYIAKIERGRTWTIYVESSPPQRVIKWSISDGQEAEMTGAKRMQYWRMNGTRFRQAVKDLGLSIRPLGSM